MTTREATSTFDGEALVEIHRSLAGKLRAHHLSQAFIDRHVDDAVQKGVVEYLRARKNGLEVREPRAFVVEAAFRRAIDELRREARKADGAALEAVLDLGRESSPAAEELAIDLLDAARLQQAVDSLPIEERQVLSLHYFEELSAKRAGELLYMSERTFRRRLGDALTDLGRLLGVTTSEPDPHRGLEIGLAAWASFGGARTVASSGLPDHLAAAVESLHRLPGRVLDRLRGTGTGLAASEAPERIGMVAGGPAGKVIGGCAGAAIVCAVSFSGVVGPGIDLGGGRAPTSQAGHQAGRPIVTGTLDPARRQQKSPEPETRQAPVEKTARSSPPTAPSRPARRESKPKVQEHNAAVAETAPSEAEVAEEQFSGITRATESAESESAAPTEGSSTTESAPSASGGESKSSATSEEARAAQEQFHGVGR